MTRTVLTIAAFAAALTALQTAPAHALPAGNLHMNGESPNGITLNGLSRNGKEINGGSYNDRTTQGAAASQLQLHGITLQDGRGIAR